MPDFDETDHITPWQAHIDQLHAEARESNRKAIKMNMISRWVYAGAALMNVVIAIFILINGRIPWISMGCIVFLAVMAVGNEAMLRANRRRSL